MLSSERLCSRKFNRYFCRSETWLYDDKSAFICALTPESYALHHAPRPDKKGSGDGCFINKLLKSEKRNEKSFKSFECMEVQLSHERKSHFERYL